MQVTSDGRTIELLSWRLRKEMLAYLARRATRSIVVGDSGARERLFFSILMTRGFDPDGVRGVGVVSERHGLVPGLIMRPDPVPLVIGSDWQVTGIRLSDLAVAYTVVLDGIFYEFLPTRDADPIVAVHELGVVAIRNDGEVAWSLSTPDILDHAEISQATLVVGSIDGPRHRYDLASGARHEER